MAGKKVAPSASALERVFRYNRPWLHLLLAGAKVATGQTPKEVVWAKNKATLHRYLPPGETRSPVPLLLVYALIDRPFIRDLIPGNSQGVPEAARARRSLRPAESQDESPVF